MKKIIILLIVFTYSFNLAAQYSFRKTTAIKRQLNPSDISAEKPNAVTKGLQDVIKPTHYFDSILLQLNNAYKVEKERIIIDNSLSLAYITAYVDSLQHRFDSIKKSYNNLKYLNKKFTSLHKSNLKKKRVIKYAFQAEEFYESDTSFNKLFRNNKIVYSPNKREMTLFTEAANDYIGPVRIGIGFALNTNKKDSTNAGDSTQKKINQEEIYKKLQNGGGDFNLKFQYPLLSNSRDNNIIFYRISAYYIAGFSFNDIKKATKDFILSNDIGIDGTVSVPGYKNKINIFGLFKAGYIFGNKNFKTSVSAINQPTNFPMVQIGAGLDFNDGYRLQMDFYSGKQFIKDNLGTTLTFTIRPGSL